MGSSADKTQVVLASHATTVLAQEGSMNVEQTTLTRCPTLQALKSQFALQEGEWVETAGFYIPGDGGAALYRIENRTQESRHPMPLSLTLRTTSLPFYSPTKW